MGKRRLIMKCMEIIVAVTNRKRCQRERVTGLTNKQETPRVHRPPTPQSKSFQTNRCYREPVIAISILTQSINNEYHKQNKHMQFKHYSVYSQSLRLLILLSKFTSIKRESQRVNGIQIR